MHFVKKETISGEEKSAEEKRRAAKSLAFIERRDRIFEKRKAGEYDEEIMTLTGELLQKNPDIYTLWNVRREALEFLAKRNETEDENDAEYGARLAKLYDDELALTQECLKQNPKSYSTWHQRYQMIARHPSANLKAELALCELALTLDCRNFHCWDHRRSVARLAKLTDADELSFSDKLIGRNPSNYSAWHYRATLLPKLFPNAEHPEVPLSDQCLAQEFEKILHVCGVNSEDQTAWTYCRWLMEIATTQKSSDEQNGSSIKRHFSTAPQCTREVPRKCLMDVAALCEQLLPEEDNPWALAALIRVKIALDGLNEQTLKFANESYAKLKKIDAQRAELYQAMLDHLLLLHALNDLNYGGERGRSQLDRLVAGDDDRLNVRGLGISSLYHALPLAGFVRQLNAEDNKIAEQQLCDLSNFSKLTHLTLDGNPIERLPSLKLPQLNFLSLARTRVRSFNDVRTAAAVVVTDDGLPALERLVLCETALADNAEEKRALVEALGGRGVRTIFYWM